MSASYGEWGSIVTLFRRPIKAGRGWALFEKLCETHSRSTT